MEQVELPEEFLVLKKTPSLAEYIRWQEMKNRILVINDGIDEYVIEEYIMPILKWNKEDEGIPAEERKPITIYLNTPGGDIFNGLVLAEVIKKSKTKIIIIALACACSMGSILLLAGHERLAYEYTNILIHDGDTGLSGTSNKVRDHMKYLEKKQKQIKDFIIGNSKITEELYDSKESSEWWITGNEGIELGIIDRIIE